MDSAVARLWVRRKVLQLILMWAGSFMLLSGCVNGPTEDLQTQCLSWPITKIPFQIPQRKQYAGHFSILQYKFPSWWKPQLGIFQYRSMPVVHTTPVTKPIYGKIVIDGENVWFTYSPDNSLARFNRQTNQIKYYSMPDQHNRPFWVEDLYLAHDGTLWAVLAGIQPNGGYSALARYLPDKDQFEIVRDKNGLFDRARGASVQDSPWPSDRHLGELPDGRLVVVLNNEIYSYEPATNQAKLIMQGPQVGALGTIAVGKDGNIWFVTSLPFAISNLQVVDSKTGKVTDYGAPPALARIYETESELARASQMIALDQQGRVWVSYFDRLEPDANGQYGWHSMRLPSVFVNTFDPYYYYRWANVYSTNVFSNGNVWFATDIGIVKYAVENDNWCLSAEVKTFSSYPLAEDADGNVWTIIDNQIYKMTP